MKTITPDEARQLISEAEKQSREQREQAARERLRELVEFARAHSPYFRRAYAGIGEDFRITDLPVTTKEDLMRDYGEWVTDPELTLSGIREYLSDVENVASSFLGRYTALTTSGTTGEPMPMVRDSYHNVIHGAMIEKRLFKSLDPKDTNPYYTKTASIIAVSGFVSSYSSTLRLKKSLGERADNLTIFSLLTPIDRLIEELNSYDPKALSGYPSILVILAKEKLRGRLNISPKVIASSAEMLSKEVFETLKEAFNCPILNNYCSTEGGEIAMSCPKGNLHLNEDWIILEPVDEDFKPAKPGEWSAGVLITDLTNYIQPIIRYHVNDRIRLSEKPCDCGCNLPVLEISGRMGDSVCFNDRTVAFPVLYFFISEIPGVLSWQAIQTGKNTMEIRFVEKAGTDRAVIGANIVGNLKKSLKEYGCGDVEILASNERFITVRGGKTPHVIKQTDTE